MTMTAVMAMDDTVGTIDMNDEGVAHAGGQYFLYPGIC